jgi:hypothetical protein
MKIYRERKKREKEKGICIVFVERSGEVIRVE